MALFEANSNEDLLTSKSAQLKRKFQLENDEINQYPDPKKMRKWKNSCFKVSILEEFCKRFPNLLKNIMTELDDESLMNLKNTSYEIHESMEQEAYFWIRILQKYLCRSKSGFSEAWRKVIDKTPVEIVKKLAETVEEFQKDSQVADYIYQPSFVVAYCGSPTLYKHTVDRFRAHNVSDEKTGTTSLHFAATSGQLDIFEFISKNVDNINPVDFEFGMTPLHYAAENGHFEICQFIIENVKDKNPANYDGWTPLHSAAIEGHLEICELISKNIDDKNPRTITGLTPLHQAAKRGFSKIYQILSENLGNKNPETLSGHTPLHKAAELGHLDICVMIIENSVEKNPRSNTGWTPLHGAARGGNFEICQVIINQLILDKITKLNPGTDKGWTPLHAAAKAGHFEICKLILENVDDANPFTTMGHSPMMVTSHPLIRKLLSTFQ